MKREELGDILKHQGQRMLELADKLSDTGNLLNTEEQTLVRAALQPLIEEATTEIKVAMIVNQKEWLDKAIDRIVEIFHSTKWL